MEMKNASQAITKYERELRQKRVAFQEAEARIQDLQAAIEGDRIEAGTLDALREQLREAEETEATYSSSYQDAVVQKDQINDAQKIVKAEMDAATQQVNEAEAKMAKAEKRLSKTRPARELALHEKNLAHDFIDVARTEKTEAERRHQRVAEELEEVTATAEQYHRRVQIQEGMTVSLIEKRIEKIEAEYRRATERYSHSAT